jgi:hypothetical protein
MAVVLYAGWKFDDVQDSMFTAGWWWFGLALVGVFALFYVVFRAGSTFKVACNTLHLPWWFFLWGTTLVNFWRCCRRWVSSAGASTSCPVERIKCKAWCKQQIGFSSDCKPLGCVRCMIGGLLRITPIDAASIA